MSGKLKIEIMDDKNVLQINELEPGKLTFVMYPDDPKDETFLEIVTDTSEFLSLLKRLLISPNSGWLVRRNRCKPFVYLKMGSILVQY